MHVDIVVLDIGEGLKIMFMVCRSGTVGRGVEVAPRRS